MIWGDDHNNWLYFKYFKTQNPGSIINEKIKTTKVVNNFKNISLISVRYINILVSVSANYRKNNRIKIFFIYNNVIYRINKFDEHLNTIYLPKI